jgi:hypothetical protein
MNIGLIQPGRLGDIFICLPIAKYYYDKGHKVVWPIFDKFVPMVREVVDYVEFIGVTDDVYKCINESYQAVICEDCETIIDLAATFPGSCVTKQYVAEGDGFGKEKFDEFKYKIAKVPFELKWNLEYKRNLEEEQKLYDLYVKQDQYDVACLDHSGGRLDVKLESQYQLIEINTKHNIFHWRKILENAQTIALVDSAIANFVEQLNLPNKKILLRKNGHPIPTFKNDWRIYTS